MGLEWGQARGRMQWWREAQCDVGCRGWQSGQRALERRTQISYSVCGHREASVSQEKSEASFFFSLETIPYLRLKLEWEKEVLEEWDPPGEERSCWK